MGSWSVYQRERGTCFSRRLGRWEPGPVGGMGVGFGEGALGGAGVSIFSARCSYVVQQTACVYAPAFASRREFCSYALLVPVTLSALTMTHGVPLGDRVGLLRCCAKLGVAALVF